MVLFGDDGIPPRSGTNCLDFQARDKKNCKSVTPVVIPNSSLPSSSLLDYVFSTPTNESILDLVSVSATNYSETLITVVLDTSTGGPGGSFGLCLSVLDAATTSSTTGMFTSLSWEGSV